MLQDQITLNQELSNFTNSVYDNASEKGIAMAIEASQRYCDYLKFLVDDIDDNPFDESVSVQIDKDTVIKFKDIDGVSEWLSEFME